MFFQTIEWKNQDLVVRCDWKKSTPARNSYKWTVYEWDTERQRTPVWVAVIYLPFDCLLSQVASKEQLNSFEGIWCCRLSAYGFTHFKMFCKYPFGFNHERCVSRCYIRGYRKHCAGQIQNVFAVCYLAADHEHNIVFHPIFPLTTCTFNCFFHWLRKWNLFHISLVIIFAFIAVGKTFATQYSIARNVALGFVSFHNNCSSVCRTIFGRMKFIPQLRENMKRKTFGIVTQKSFFYSNWIFV